MIWSADKGQHIMAFVHIGHTPVQEVYTRLTGPGRL